LGIKPDGLVLDSHFENCPLKCYCLFILGVEGLD